MSKYNVLVARLQKELTSIQVVVETATVQIEKAKKSGDNSSEDLQTFCSFLQQL